MAEPNGSSSSPGDGAEALFAKLPESLRTRCKLARLGLKHQVPALLCHPDWSSSRPMLLWMHGRTADKFLDSGRYLRLIRAGIAVVALDLPAHGERLDPPRQSPDHTPELLTQMVSEIDGVLESLAGEAFVNEGGLELFDLDRAAIGGMSAGGMVTLRRLCETHPFRCAAVESTAGDLGMLWDPRTGWPVAHREEVVAALDPMRRIASFRPLPLLALHSETDQIVPIRCARSFLDALRDSYVARGFPGDWVRLHTWPTTGAPAEHNGFGRVAAEAKTLHVEFLVKHLEA
jgi:alpha-beta hydrolase superfamily lysophospholipase